MVIKTLYTFFSESDFFEVLWQWSIFWKNSFWLQNGILLSQIGPNKSYTLLSQSTLMIFWKFGMMIRHIKKRKMRIVSISWKIYLEYYKQIKVILVTILKKLFLAPKWDIFISDCPKLSYFLFSEFIFTIFIFAWWQRL